jgi:ribosomal protein S12
MEQNNKKLNKQNHKPKIKQVILLRKISVPFIMRQEKIPNSEVRKFVTLVLLIV